MVKKFQDKSQDSKKDTGRKESKFKGSTMNQENNSEENNGSMQQEDEAFLLNVRFLITSGLRDIDKEIFHIIHENGLVYNGRLIIKNNF